MATPQYIDRGGELVFTPPFLAEKVDFYGFMLDADITKLQAQCDKYLNAPLGGEQRFIPAGGFIMLACCNLPSLRSTSAPYSNWGWFPEKEIAFWLLTIDKKTKNFYWLLPYIWVDNPYAMAMGRELYGFPKGIGTIILPASPDTPDQFSIDTLAIEKFSPSSQGKVERLVDVVQTTTKAKHGLGGAFKDVEGLVKEIMHIMDDGLSLLGNAKLALDGLDDLFNLYIPLVFLKEFRDVVTPTNTCFQAVVETLPKAEKVYGAKLYSNDFNINIKLCDSHPIVSDLGLSTTNPITPSLSFWVNFDFIIGTGTQTIAS
jgi:hypothetical protein